MLPLHCSNCGRILGRAEKETFEGRTVCPRCLVKLGGGEPPPKHSIRAVVITLAITIVVGGVVVGGLVLLIKRFVD